MKFRLEDIFFRIHVYSYFYMDVGGSGRDVSGTFGKKYSTQTETKGLKHSLKMKINTVNW